MRSGTWWCLVILCSACGDDGVGKLPDAPPQVDAPPDAPACPPQTGAGTMHSTGINADETWRAADGPHIVTQSINIRGATLTIEPCSVVRLRQGMTFTIGQTAGGANASIVARGDAMRPIRFERDIPAMPWGSLRVFPTGSVDLEHVTLVGGADPQTAQNGGGVIVSSGNGGNMGLTRHVRVVNVRIEGSAGFGVNVTSRGAFSADSANLTITGAGAMPNATGIDNRYPITVDGATVSTIPTGTYTGNALDAIRLANAGSLLDPEITFHNRGIPYHMDASFSMSPMTSAAAGGLSTLTIEAGVTIKFNDGGAASDPSMSLGSSGGPLPANIFPVRVIAAGTAAAPIVLTSSMPVPAAGDWAGIEWLGGPPDGNVMSYVRIEYAGGNAGNAGFGCGVSDNDAALMFAHWRPSDVFITNSTISNSASGGIVSGWQTDLNGPNLVGNNTFTAIANGCNVARWRDDNGSCPSTPPVCL